MNGEPGPVAAGRAERLHAALSRALGTDAWRLELRDGGGAGPVAEPEFTLRLRGRRGLDRLLGALPLRAFVRAYVAGDLEVEPLEPFLEALHGRGTALLARAWPGLVAASLALGARPDLRPAAVVEPRLAGRRHSPRRDAAAIRHHYDLDPEFYALWLDSSMTYSCAYFERPDVDLDTAQEAKLEHVCRKLRLRPGERLLDVGSGWGSLVIHAARHHGVHATGVTLSPRQAAVSTRRIAEAGLEGRAEVRLADYREPLGEHDAVASVGMLEHVGRRAFPVYGRALRGAVRRCGRVLAHGITIRGARSTGRGTLLEAFVFPDGQVHPVGLVVSFLEEAGLEVRDVEGLREHYALTLRSWVARLRERRDRAEALVGVERVRLWDLYMSGAEVSFRRGSLSLHQVLAVRPGERGESGVPLTRADWYAPAG